MSEKLKFKDEEVVEKLSFEDDGSDITETPPDVGLPIDEPAAETENGGETPDGDIADDNFVDSIPNPDVEKTDTSVKSKLYERESSLKFTEPQENKEMLLSKSKSEGSDKIFGVTSDDTDPTPKDDSPADNLTATNHNGDNTTVEVNSNNNPNDTPIAEPDNNENTPNIVDTDTTAQNPKPSLADVKQKVAAIAPAAKSTTPVKPIRPTKSKLKFSKEVTLKTKEEKQTAKQDKKIGELEYKTDLYAYKRDKALAKQPTQIKKVKERYYDENKQKVKTKIRFEEIPVPINEAKWNLPKKQALPVMGAAALTTIGVNKLHSKIYQAEGENVGTQAAHQVELVGESAYRGSKRLIHSTYRYVKNTPYRQAEKFEAKTIKSRMKLDYEKALKDNPKLKSNPASRFMQKRQIKRQYADALRKAKKSGETIKKTGNIITKTAQVVTATVRRNPVVLLGAGVLLLIIFAIMSMFTMCTSIFSGGSGVIGAASYAADDADIDQAELSYTEWETDLQVKIDNAETTHPDYDEYRYNIDNIGHDPFELMAFLTAVYQDFTYSDIENVLHNIFDQQYNLEFVPETEIRYRWEQVGWQPVVAGYDIDGFPIISWYPVYDWVPYEWHILNVNLTSVPLMSVLEPLMTDDQKEHFDVLMQTRGARQYGGNPFDFDWIPGVSSGYGWRISPITGEKELHRGVDIPATAGTEIRAGVDGTVTTAAFDSSYGNYVVINDGKGIEMKYAHCSTLLVSVGDTVKKGDVIATVGSTGDSTGNHLHMEILKDGGYLNPAYFVESFIY